MNINKKLVVFSFVFSLFSVVAEISNGDVYGDWSAICGTIDDSAVCALEQELKDSSDQTVVKVSIVRNVSGTLVASVKVPLFVNLQAGLGFGVDGELLSQAKYLVCDEVGCLSVIKLDDGSVEKLKKGKELNIGVYLGQDVKMTNGSLKGITKGLNNL